MIEWWTTLSTAMKILWGITLSASLIFVIQTILTFIGADGSMDTDFDASGMDVDIPDASDVADAGSGMSLLTFRNFINFLIGFGWSAILLRESVNSTSLLLIISVLVGIGLVAIVMMIFKWLTGMQQSGNINLDKCAAGCQGKVYLTIPAERNGQGKVQITINNAVREYDAVTDGDALKTGKDIRVLEVINGTTLLVEEINSLII